MALPFGSGGLLLAPPWFMNQTDAFLNQANPVSGTKYTVLDTVRNVRILSMGIMVTWTVQPTPLELHGTIDGITYKWSKTNPVSATWYFPYVSPQLATNAQVLTNTLESEKAFYIDAKSVKIEAETTGGTSNPLQCRVRYAKYQ